ncbi:MAG TPA: NAD-dependent epimerase/dehydratase family protein [Candidatus Dormibacteraeota bacterium]|nr:NAD-dependent epimerase/dehydratase family protein [Candidatus Dormibacteraeota bacterium]
MSAGRVLVTGGAGFIGSNLARRLTARGTPVRVVDNFSVGQRQYLASVDAEVVEGDVTDPSFLKRVLPGASRVVHLAAATSVLDSINDPVSGLAVNVAGLVSLLQAATAEGVESFVFASSNAAVGEAPTPVSEEQVARPSSPYGASKLAGEAYCSAFARSYGLPTTALRFANVYGSNSLHKQSAVHRFIRIAIAGGQLTINGDGRQTRDFIHVDDICVAIEACLDRPVVGGLFQVGTGSETSILELVELLARIHGGEIKVMHGPANPGEVQRNFSDVAKADRDLGFAARVELADGLARTYAWYSEQLSTERGQGVLAREGD